jgi:ABC-type dipeptide/oligopeptide/nickel transport system ATPase component
MKKIKNLIYLFIFTGALLALKFLVIDKIFTNLGNDADIWFTSGLLLVVLGIFVTEKYFTKPLDVIVNVILLFVVLSMLENVGQFLLYGPLLVYSLLVGAIAFISFVLIDEEKDRNFLSQKIAHSSNIISGFLGSSRMLFSIVFILSIFGYFISSLENNFLINKEQIAVLSLIGFWGILILIEPIDKKLIAPLFEKIKNKNQPSLVGKIAKRLNPDVIYIEQLPGAPILKSGDVVFLDDIKNSHIGKDLIYALFISELEADNKKYLHFYCLNSLDTDINKQIYVYKNDSEIPETISNLETYKSRNNVIGFVHSNSDIDVIKIRMIEGIDESRELKEGDLVAVNFYKKSTKYQIINVETESESIDGQSKQGGKIITAQQIGYWEKDKQKFADTGWVPSINAPVFIESSTEEIKITNDNVYKVGIVPRSQYPIFIDFEESVNHHIAVIGKTGTGKSRMAAQILEKMSSNGYKVVVFEVDRKNKQSLTSYIDSASIEEQKSNEFDLSKATKNIVSVDWQLDDKDKTGGTINLSDMTADLIEKVVGYQTKNEEQKICIVMEEAYDFIPENTFGKQDFGQPKVSRISQMVLKCRKHNIGFLIITQRTALVTKTILYQCHTIIALQSFDETSKNFMSAYINQKYLDSMSILPRFRAIVVGKGSSCDKPVIVDFFDKQLVECKNKKAVVESVKEKQK